MEMIGNRTLIQKADLTVQDMINDGGYLQPAQAQAFIRTLIDRSTVMPLSTVVPMRAPTQRLEKLRFGSRVLRAGTEAQALGQNDRAKPDLELEELNAQLFKAEVRLNNEVLQDSIEGGRLRETIMATLGERISLDMDEVIVNGDTASADPFLAKFDGIMKQAAANVVNNGGNLVSRTLWKDMLKAMPSEFLRNKRLMRFLVSVDTEIEYRDSVAARETNVGDAFLQGDAPASYGGVPILDVPVIRQDLGVGNNRTEALLTDPKNVNVGVWRRIEMETDKDITAGELIIVATLRFDARLAENRATVKGIDIAYA
jgi:HK97 family phage major capsid protein